MSYLQNLAGIFAREEKNNLKNCVFVFPNQRAGLFFRRYLGIAIGHPALSPTVLTINDCFYSLTDTKLADPIDLLLRVARIHNEIRAEQHLDPEPLDKFLFWGRMMLGDFNEIDNHLVTDVKKFFENIHDLHTIDTHFQNDKQGSLQTADNLYEIYQRLNAELKADGLAYDGMLHREVIEKLQATDDRQQAADGHTEKTYVFVGFNALTTSEEQLLLYFRDRGQADFYFDYSDTLVVDEHNCSSLFMKHNQVLFPSKYTLPPISSNPRFNYIEVNSTVAEAQEVHRILSTLYASPVCKESDRPSVSKSLTKTAVVLPDERLLIPLLHTLPESIDKVNVTMGYPLSATPTYALISLVSDLRKRMTDNGFYHKDVTAILSHPYIHRLSPESCDAIKQDIIKRNRIYVDSGTFAKDEYLSLIFSTEPNTWRDILNHFPEDASEAVYKVQTVLNRIDKYLGDWSQATGDRQNFQLSTLDIMLSSETIAYVGEPLEGLQIMGILEKRALDFDHIILTGFNDDLYPGNSITNSFIPYQMRCQYGLPTAERKDAIFAYNFYRMIGYAKEVWFIANTHADDQHSGEPSRYLYQLQYQFGKEIQHYAVTDRLQATDDRLQATGDWQQATGGLKPQRSFNPSGLNAYLRCPRSYYWHYVCGIQEPEEVKEDIDPRELGNRLHLLLQNFYEPFCGKTVTTEDIDAMLRQLPTGEDPLSMLVREYAGLFLERDRALAPFTYIATEQSRQMDLTLDDGSVVTLKGTIDRVDSTSATPPHQEETVRGLRIVDYKTGSAKLEFPSIASLFDPEDKNRNSYALQTIFYAILYGGGEPHIYGVRLLATGAETAVHQKGQEAVNIEEIKDEFLTHLRKLIAEIRDPRNEFLMKEDVFNKCNHCAFSKLCEK